MANKAGAREIPLAEFILGNRRTARRPDEIVTGIEIPRPAEKSVSAFSKLGARRYLVISIAMVAAVVEHDDAGTVTAARIAVGSCSETARRLPALEAALTGGALATLGDAVDPAHLDGLSPIDDVRGTAAYRRDAALTLVRRTLDGLGRGA
jgi:CO/xanthine dehydrogenase FAD-binding subunit